MFRYSGYPGLQSGIVTEKEQTLVMNTDAREELLMKNDQDTTG
jgi:hypothetical protein